MFDYEIKEYFLFFFIIRGSYIKTKMIKYLFQYIFHFKGIDRNFFFYSRDEWKIGDKKE